MMCPPTEFWTPGPALSQRNTLSGPRVSHGRGAARDPVFVCVCNACEALSWRQDRRSLPRSQSRSGARLCTPVHNRAPQFSAMFARPSGLTRQPSIWRRNPAAASEPRNTGYPGSANHPPLPSLSSSPQSRGATELVCVRPLSIRAREAGRGRRTNRRAIVLIAPGSVGGTVKAWSAGPRAITGDLSCVGGAKVARRSHKPEVMGSSPIPATTSPQFVLRCVPRLRSPVVSGVSHAPRQRCPAL